MGNQSSNSINPATQAQAVVPSDTVNLPWSARGLYVGTGGTVVAVLEDNTTITLTSVQSGTFFGNFVFTRINSTNTTASNMVAFK